LTIFSPVPSGCGAYIVHRLLAEQLPNYQLRPYPPLLSLVPPLLYRYRDPQARLVHTTPDYGLFAHYPRQPLILTFHGYALDQAFRAHSSWLQNLHSSTDLRYFTQQAVARAQVITAVSQYTADLVRQDLPCTAPIRVIYNGVDTERFQPALGRRTSAQVQVLFSGNLTRRKGALWLPAIAAHLHPGILVHYTQGLRTRCTLPTLPNLRSVGAVAYTDMPQHYQAADILLMPTVREGFGLAVAEAMACGLPVVASDVSALPELVVEGQGGFLCPVGDVACFAARLNQLADDPVLRRQMGEFNRARASALFNLPRMVRQYHELFNEVLDVSSNRL
jgi:glycosyltransferase involved in cell wall biosynthesis